MQVYDVFDLAEDLFTCRETHFLWAGTDHVLDEAAVQVDLANYAFFAIENLPGSLTSVQLLHRSLALLGSSSDVTVNTAQLYLVNKDIDTTELEVKNYFSVQLILVSKTSRQFAQEFSESTRPFQNWSSKAIQQKILLPAAEQGMAMEVDDLLFIQDY